VTGLSPEPAPLAIARVLAGGLLMPGGAVDPDTLTPLTVDCPACGGPIELPARACIGDNGGDLLVSLDDARKHASEHGESDDLSRATVMPAVLARFGVFW
jgi:hypothetical protein